MSDPGPKLRAYLDQTVERVDVEDVMARARIRKPRAPQPFVHWRPAWIAVAAALIMLISIGAVAAGAWLLRGEGIGEFVARPDGASGPPTAAAQAEKVPSSNPSEKISSWADAGGQSIMRQAMLAVQIAVDRRHAG